MVPVLFPGVPGGLELLVVLVLALALLGLPLFLLAVGGFGYWRLGRDRDQDSEDDETVAQLRRRVDEMEAQLADAGDRGEAGTDGAAEGESATDRGDAAPDVASTDRDDAREGRE